MGEQIIIRKADPEIKVSVMQHYIDGFFMGSCWSEDDNSDDEIIIARPTSFNRASSQTGIYRAISGVLHCY